jgi:hypothetical protein
LSPRSRTASPRRARYQRPTRGRDSKEGTMTPPPSGSWRQGYGGGTGSRRRARAVEGASSECGRATTGREDTDHFNETYNKASGTAAWKRVGLGLQRGI